MTEEPGSDPIGVPLNHQPVSPGHKGVNHKRPRLAIRASTAQTRAHSDKTPTISRQNLKTT